MGTAPLGVLHWLAEMRKRKKNPAAVALGKLGAHTASKAGKARWEGISPEDRSEIMRRLSLAYWRKRKAEEKKRRRAGA